MKLGREGVLCVTCNFNLLTYVEEEDLYCSQFFCKIILQEVCTIYGTIYNCYYTCSWYVWYYLRYTPTPDTNTNTDTDTGHQHRRFNLLLQQLTRGAYVYFWRYRGFNAGKNGMVWCCVKKVWCWKEGYGLMQWQKEWFDTK